MTSEGQRDQEVCRCGRPTYGAPQCRRCNAIDRAVERDRQWAHPHPLCLDEDTTPPARAGHMPPPPTDSVGERVPRVPDADETRATLDRLKTGGTDQLARLRALRQEMKK